MSNYVKLTDFASKDALPTGTPAKIIKGTEIDDEFQAIENAMATKADINSPALTGSPTAPTAAAGTATTQIATTAFVGSAITTSETATNASIAAVVMPSGAVLPFAMATAPTGWLKCDGSAYSRETYADLFAAIGVTYGSGDGTTTFNVPDLRGEFIRGWDDGRGVDALREIGTSQLDAFQNFTGTISGQQEYLTGSGAFYSNSASSGSRPNNDNNLTRSVTLDPSTVARTADETRPRNVAMNYCIKF